MVEDRLITLGQLVVVPGRQQTINQVRDRPQLLDVHQQDPGVEVVGVEQVRDGRQRGPAEVAGEEVTQVAVDHRIAVEVENPVVVN